MRKHHTLIYKSWAHVLVTVGVVILPFLFFLFFAELNQLTIHQLFYNVFISVLRLGIAYVIALILAWIIAVSFYRGKRSAIVLPVADVLQSFPSFAALPLATLYWGVNNFTVVFFLVITVIWPVLFSIISSLKLIKHEWEEAVTISGLKGWNYIRYYIFPVTLPGIATGSIIGLGDGWEALVGTEIIVGIKTGLGSFFETFSTNPRITFFGIFGLLLVIFAFNKLIWLPLLERSHILIEE
jgi:NitT/TauT family transport system permease protein